jgi:hypothetical protein
MNQAAQQLTCRCADVPCEGRCGYVCARLQRREVRFKVCLKRQDVTIGPDGVVKMQLRQAPDSGRWEWPQPPPFKPSHVVFHSPDGRVFLWSSDTNAMEEL